MMLTDSVLDQTREVASLVAGVDPRSPVPTCPEWSVRDLVEHIGATQRWVTRLVEERATDPAVAFSIPWEQAPEDPGEWAAWLEDGATAAVSTIDRAPADVAVFDPGRTGDGLSFWSARLFGEVSVHRLDVALSVGQPYTLAPALASEAVDDWLSTVTSAGWAAMVPGFAEAMRGSGQTIRWSARDADRSWLVRRTDAPLELERSAASTAPTGLDSDVTVAIEGDAVDLLGVLSRRRPLDGPATTVISGDRPELDHFVDHMVWIGAR
ncbi:maleylpyruvate isomerase family mycothiol-dependent enzyme [Phycicoccus avicenniae]|uniref:maleylpyruvate isomerase family mycothiol-dependent enzyme n=1 Tax=Phycicoccus avicenniae TaxID=2828860 RepID=UPI003D2E998C